jgi:hypothetical protein
MNLNGNFSRMVAKPGDGLHVTDVDRMNKIRAHAVRPLDHDYDCDESAGWACFAHPLSTIIYDEAFRAEYLILAFRVDSIKVHSRTLKLRQEEAEAVWLEENQRTTIPRGQRNAIREQVATELRAKTPVQIEVFPVVWNTETDQVWVWTQSAKRLEQVAELFEDTFDRCLEVVDPEHLTTRAYPDWTSCADVDMTSLGSEFLAWLWWDAEVNEGSFTALNDRLELSGGTIETAYRAQDPTEIAEARLGLRSGRVVTSMGLVLSQDDRKYTANLRACDLAFRSVKLPLLGKGEEECLFETLRLMEELDHIVNTLFFQFLDVRLAGWASVQSRIQRWARTTSQGTITQLENVELQAVVDAVDVAAAEIAKRDASALANKLIAKLSSLDEEGAQAKILEGIEKTTPRSSGRYGLLQAFWAAENAGLARPGLLSWINDLIAIAAPDAANTDDAQARATA